MYLDTEGRGKVNIWVGDEGRQVKRHSIIVMCGSHEYELTAPTGRRCQRRSTENVLRRKHAVLSAE